MLRINLEIVDKELSLLRRKIRTGSLIPLNHQAEQKKVFKDNTYDPTFRYSTYPHDMVAIVKRLLSLKTDHSTFGKLLEQKRQEFLHLMDIIRNVGKVTPITTHSIAVHGAPTKDLVKKATAILRLDAEPEPLPHDTFDSTKKFLDALLCKGLNWQVKKKDMILDAAISSTNKIIYINKNRRFSDHDLKRLLVHEVGTHIMRHENAKLQSRRMFTYGFPHYLETEEGLAVYNEDAAGLLNNNILRKYAGRVLAVHLSLSNGFSTVYNSLLEHCTPKEAWSLTLRAKRGIGNTSQPGAYAKDHVYLNGYYRVKNYVIDGGKINALYVGKIGVEHVPLLEKI